MTFRFGMIVGMRRTKELRALVLCRAVDKPPARWYRETWHALVLADEDSKEAYGFTPGEIVTLSPGMQGLIVFDDAEEAR